MKKTSSVYLAPAEELRVAGNYDVVVVGGGPSGIGAALGAARSGMKTLLVEQFNCLGGVATAAGLGMMSSNAEHGTDRLIIRGVVEEVVDRIEKTNAGHRLPGNVMFDVERLKYIYDQMMHEAGVSVLFHTFFCSTIVEKGKVAGVIIQNKSGRQAVFARRVIDATGDGDVAFSAGCEYETGRAADGKCQPATLMFTVGNVAWPKVRAFREANGGPWSGLEFVFEKAVANGDMDPFTNKIHGISWSPANPDQVEINLTHMTGVDSTKAEDLTTATIEGRRQVFVLINVLRKYIPGMENARLISLPATVGLRESRRILGEYYLTEQDLMAQREFEDGICYGSYFIDIHHIDGPGSDSTCRERPRGFKYHIPYRSLVPRKIDNLLVAGRCISVSHIALGSTRVMMPCMAMGEAAGIAAALSIQQNVPPRNVDVRMLRDIIRERGGILDETDIRKYNPT